MHFIILNFKLMLIREISSGITLLFIHKHFVNNTNMFRKLKMTYTYLRFHYMALKSVCIKRLTIES